MGAPTKRMQVSADSPVAFGYWKLSTAREDDILPYSNRVFIHPAKSQFFRKAVRYAGCFSP